MTPQPTAEQQASVEAIIRKFWTPVSLNVSDAASAVLALIHTREREVRRLALEEAMTMMRTWLVYDSQRAVSWHEIQDCLDATRALLPQAPAPSGEGKDG